MIERLMTEVDLERCIIESCKSLLDRSGSSAFEIAKSGIRIRCTNHDSLHKAIAVDVEICTYCDKIIHDPYEKCSARVEAIVPR